MALSAGGRRSCSSEQRTQKNTAPKVGVSITNNVLLHLSSPRSHSCRLFTCVFLCVSVCVSVCELHVGQVCDVLNDFLPDSNKL